jgi:hypothetical protein
MPGKINRDVHVWCKSCFHTTSGTYKKHAGKENLKLLPRFNKFPVVLKATYYSPIIGVALKTD